MVKRRYLAAALYVTRSSGVIAALPDTTLGCERWGCDPANSFSTQLQPPQGAGALSPQYLWRAPFELQGANASQLSSPGCISDGKQATCAANAPYGLLSVSPNGSTIWAYASAGAYPACSESLPFSAANLPVCDEFGDVVAWDGSDVVLLNNADGSVGWDRTVYPPGVCGAALTSPSVTGNGDLSFTLQATGEVFAYLADGIPQSYILLQGADSGTVVFPPPEQPRTGQDSSSEGGAAVPSPSPSPKGVFVPISQQGMDGERILLVARYYAFSPGGGGDPPQAQPLVPTASIYLLGVDQRNAAVDRLYWQWQLSLPLEGTGLEACMPPGTPPFIPPAVDPLTVVGPVGVPGAAGATTVMLSCGRGSATAFAFGAVVNGQSAPAVTWGAVINGSASESLPRDSTRANEAAGASTAWYWAVDPAPANATAHNSSALLLASAASSHVTAVDSATGAPRGAYRMPVALTALGHEQCELGLAMQQPGAAFLPTGPMLTSTDGVSTFITVPGQAVVAGSAYSPRYWIAAFAILPQSRSALTGLWCAPTPPLNASSSTPEGAYGAVPVTGQMAVMRSASAGDDSDAGSGTVLVVPMPDAIWGLADAPEAAESLGSVLLRARGR